MKSKRTRIEWSKELDNPTVQAAYIKFVKGELSRRGIESILKNTKHAGTFRTLVTSDGSDRARDVARKALSRRALI